MTFTKEQVEERLQKAVINLDKPMGPSSHQVTSWVKRLIGLEKAGHGGTLDPRVTGVLVIMLGDSAKGSMALKQAEKEYVGVVRFHADVKRSAVEEEMSRFIGPIYQKPPIRSAVKRVRRVRTIHELELLDMDGRDVLIRTRCESGTYIRTLAKDIGRAMGIGAHLQELRRTISGPFNVDDSVTLQDLSDALWRWREKGDPEALMQILQPWERLFDHLSTITIKDTAVDALCHGAPLAAPGILKIEGAIEKDRLASVHTQRGELVGLVRASVSSEEMLEATEGIVATPRAMYMRPDTYPKGWK